MGCGWYRTAYYPAEAQIDRRSVDDLADELVREATEGVGGTRRPARDHRRDRHRQAVGLAVGGAGPSGGGAGGAQDRAGDHDPRRAVAESASPSSGSSRRRVPTSRGSSSAMPIRTRVLDHYLAIIERGREHRVRLHRHALGAASGTARRERRAGLRAAGAWPRRPYVPQPGRLQRLAARRPTAATATPTWPTRSCRGCGQPASPRTRSRR